MGDCSDEVRVLVALGVLGVLLIWIGVAVVWAATLRVLRASTQALAEVTEWRRVALSVSDERRPTDQGPTPRV